MALKASSVNSLLEKRPPNTSSLDRRIALMPRLAEELSKIEAKTSKTALDWLKVAIGLVMSYDEDILIITQRYRMPRVSGGMSTGTYPCNAPDDLDLALELAFQGDARYAISEICDRQIIMFPNLYGGVTIRMLPKM